MGVGEVVIDYMRVVKGSQLDEISDEINLGLVMVCIMCGGMGEIALRWINS